MFLNLFTNIQSRMLDAQTRRTDREEGAVAVEYALLVVLIALVMAVGAAVLGGKISDKFSGISLNAPAPVVP